jgi:NADH-quinone oxidoreductase subunit J
MSVEFLFYLLGSITLAGAYGTISCRQPVHAALCMIVVLLALSGLFALLSNSFLFAVQIILYAGAILALLLFIIMFLNVRSENLPEEHRKYRHQLASMVLSLPFIVVVVKAILTLPEQDMSIREGFGAIKRVGQALFVEWVVPFELVSVLLLVALVGAVTLGKGVRNG